MASDYPGFGLHGGEYINDTAAHAGEFFEVIATDDTVISTINSNIEKLSDINN